MHTIIIIIIIIQIRKSNMAAYDQVAVVVGTQEPTTTSPRSKACRLASCNLGPLYT
jgi:hypothetical protein